MLKFFDSNNLAFNRNITPTSRNSRLSKKIQDDERYTQKRKIRPEELFK